MINIPSNIFRAVRLFSAANDNRLSINGIAVEVTEDDVRLIATDGCIIVVYRQPNTNHIDPFEPRVIPIALAKKVKSMPHSVQIGFDGDIVTLTQNGASFSDRSYITSYPLYRKVIPTSVSMEPAEFSLYYLSIAYAAWELLAGKDSPMPRVLPNGKKQGALIDMGRDDLAVSLMPCGFSDRPVRLPLWI